MIKSLGELIEKLETLDAQMRKGGFGTSITIEYTVGAGHKIKFKESWRVDDSTLYLKSDTNAFDAMWDRAVAQARRSIVEAVASLRSDIERRQKDIAETNLLVEDRRKTLAKMEAAIIPGVTEINEE